MAALTLELVCNAAFEQLEETKSAMVLLVARLSRSAWSGGLFTRLFWQPLPADVENLAFVLAHENHTTDGPTHTVVLAAQPDGPEVGTIYLGVGPKAHERGDVVGLRFVATLDEADFDLGRASMATLLAEAVDAVQADEGFIGPDAWGRTRRVGWATYVPDEPSSTHETALVVLKGLGLVTSPTARGAIVEAHREEPTSTSTAAQNAVDLVRHILDDPTSAPRAVIAEAAAPKEIPSYLRSERQGVTVTVREHEEHPSQQPSVLTMGTLVPLDGPAPPSTPFVRPSENAPSIKKTEAAPRAISDTGTVALDDDGPDLLTTGTLDEAHATPLPFADSATDLSPSSVSGYARFSAELHQSNDRDAIYQRHGLTPESYAALATHWRGRMRDDATLRDAFNRLFQQWTRKLAQGGTPR